MAASMAHRASRRASFSNLATLAVAAATLLFVVETAAAMQCSDYNDAVEGSYWFVTERCGVRACCLGLTLLAATLRNEVQNCTACVSQPQCGFCLSTLQCVDGDVDGPADGAPCPDWTHVPVDCPGA